MHVPHVHTYTADNPLPYGEISRVAYYIGMSWKKHFEVQWYFEEIVTVIASHVKQKYAHISAGVKFTLVDCSAANVQWTHTMPQVIALLFVVTVKLPAVCAKNLTYALLNRNVWRSVIAIPRPYSQQHRLITSSVIYGKLWFSVYCILKLKTEQSLYSRSKLVEGFIATCTRSKR